MARRIAATRPTAVNLSWAVNRVVNCAERTPGDSAAILEALRQEATAILDEDRAMCRRIGEAGADLLTDGARADALQRRRACHRRDRNRSRSRVRRRGARQDVRVLATETRPLLQGSRLTAWELTRAGIPVTVITDSAAASRMRAGEVDLCIVGADRVVANGDVANKVGTYSLAVLARHHGIPFYVAMPTSTIDPSLASGDEIVIEERDPEEVSTVLRTPHRRHGVAVGNAAFDVTPASLVTAFITDRGIIRPPYNF